jgi:hypothetical protein
MRDFAIVNSLIVRSRDVIQASGLLPWVKEAALAVLVPYTKEGAAAW